MKSAKTSKRVAKIAAKELLNKKLSKKLKAPAGSALRQYEPKKKHKKK